MYLNIKIFNYNFWNAKYNFSNEKKWSKPSQWVWNFHEKWDPNTSFLYYFFSLKILQIFLIKNFNKYLLKLFSLFLSFLQILQLRKIFINFKIYVQQKTFIKFLSKKFQALFFSLNSPFKKKSCNFLKNKFWTFFNLNNLLSQSKILHI